MIQLGFSFGIIFHQTRANAAKKRLISFIIGFIIFITLCLITMAIVADKAKLDNGIAFGCTKFFLDLGIAI